MWATPLSVSSAEILVKSSAWQRNPRGHLRGVLARLTPEQVNEDRLTFAETVKLDVDEDFDMLGLALDTLKIQNAELGQLS